MSNKATFGYDDQINRNIYLQTYNNNQYNTAFYNIDDESLVNGYWKQLNHDHNHITTSQFIHLCFMYYFDQTHKHKIKQILRSRPQNQLRLGLIEHYVKFNMKSFTQCIGKRCKTIHLTVNKCNTMNEVNCMECTSKFCLQCKKKAHSSFPCDNIWNEWRYQITNKLKNKLRINIVQKHIKFQDVVNDSVQKILHNRLIKTEAIPLNFIISSTFITDTIDKMNNIIDCWPDFLLSSEKFPPKFKYYMHFAETWWNNEKGKWFGDLFFWHVLHNSLPLYCKQILFNNENQLEYNYLFCMILYDILHSKISIQKNMSNALLKSSKLQHWFSDVGKEYGVECEISTQIALKSIRNYVKNWVSKVKVHEQNIYNTTYITETMNNNIKSTEYGLEKQCVDNIYENETHCNHLPTVIAPNSNLSIACIII